MKEHDHAPLREAIEAVVAQDGHEGAPLPRRPDADGGRQGKRARQAAGRREEARRLARRSTGSPTRPLSTYVRSAGLFGNEMHSPIMCIGNGVPAIVCRFAEQTNKGFMWRDIGLGDWLFTLDDDADLPRSRPDGPVALRRIRRLRRQRPPTARAVRRKTPTRNDGGGAQGGGTWLMQLAASGGGLSPPSVTPMSSRRRG